MKDSGKREDMSTGSRRDTQVGKSRPDLMNPLVLRRLGQHFANGCEKYGEKNFELGQQSSRYRASLGRHLLDYDEGKMDEDHLSAIIWNAMGLVMNQEFVERGIYPAEIDDSCNYLDKEGFRATVGSRAMAHNDALRKAEVEETNRKLVVDLPVRDEPNRVDLTPNIAMAEIEEMFMSPIMESMKAFMDMDEEDGEDLVEVPEVPVCFGNCAGSHCVDCKDKPECDTHECGEDTDTECEFSMECDEEFTACDEDSTFLDDIAQEEINEDPVVHVTEQRKDCFNCNFSQTEAVEFPCRTCSRDLNNVAVYPRDMWMEG